MSIARLPTGCVLFALDALIACSIWPALLAVAQPAMLAAGDPRTMLYPAADLLVLYAMGLYRRDAMVERMRSLARIPLVVGLGAALAVCTSLALLILFPGFEPPPAHDQAQVFAIATVCFTASAYLARALLSGLLARRLLRRKLLVVGAGERAWDLLFMLRKEGNSLEYEVALLHDPVFGPADPRLAADNALLRLQGQDVLAAARHVGADQIIVAPDERRGMNVMHLLECKVAGFPVLQYLSFVEKEIRRVDLKRMEPGWLVYSDGFSFDAIDRFLKRIFDIAISSALLLLATPLLLGAMLAIRTEGPGPIFYRQERVTRNGRVFSILKLRTMRVDAEASGAVWARERDNRITRAGAFLRRSRIDELPQLWNVLKGEMSFVGPRPERPMFVDDLATRIPLYRERHIVKAGLTGWAQINYPYGASIDDARSKLSYDLYYVKNFSILFDFVILLQTLRVVLWPSGVR
jgi:sugar transferase (PEP-CTERM system associated)